MTPLPAKQPPEDRAGKQREKHALS
jgi:hypothetical protein